MGGFNGVNGILMDLSWMSAPRLLGGTGVAVMWVMVSTFLATRLRSIYTRGISVEAVAH